MSRSEQWEGKDGGPGNEIPKESSEDRVKTEKTYETEPGNMAHHSDLSVSQNSRGKLGETALLHCSGMEARVEE